MKLTHHLTGSLVVPDSKILRLMMRRKNGRKRIVNVSRASVNVAQIKQEMFDKTLEQILLKNNLQKIQKISSVSRIYQK